MLNLHRLDAIECHTALEVELLAALVHERKLRLTGADPRPFPHSLVPPDPVQSVLPSPTHPDYLIASEANVQQIQRAVCRRWRISLNEVLAQRRQGPICLARHVAMVLCQTLTPRSYPVLGRMFKRDHTTVLNSVRKYQWLKLELAAELSPEELLVVWVERAAEKTVTKPVAEVGPAEVENSHSVNESDPTVRLDSTAGPTAKVDTAQPAVA